MFLIAGGVVAALVLTVAAAAVVVLATAPGHALLRDWILRTLARSVDGRVRIGEISGALWRGVVARDVELAMGDGTGVLRIEHMRVGYAIPDLLRGRIVLSGITIARPALLLVQDSTGRWNIERLLRLTEPDSGPGGPRPLVVLRDLVLADGTIMVRPWRPDRPVSWTMTGVHLELDRLRASHPDSTAIEAAIRQAALRLDSPAVTLEGAAGTISLDGDSVRFRLDRVRLPATRLSLAGRAAWGGEHPVVHATVQARRFAFAAFRGLAPRVPREGGGQLSAEVRWLPNGAQAYELRELSLTSGRSSLSAAGRVTRSSTGAVAVRGLRARLEPLDLALLGVVMDTVPARGLVRGDVRADGALADLGVSVEVAWTDEDARPVVTSSVAARGRLGLDREPFRIPALDIVRSSVGLPTLRRFEPGLRLDGRLELTGHATYAADTGSFAGALVHAGVAGATTRLAGTLDVRRGSPSPTLTATLAADSLSFDALRAGYPELPLRGLATGRVQIGGTFDSLAYYLDLAGAWGGLSGDGAVRVADTAVRVTGDGQFDSLDVRRHFATAPTTRLAGTWRADVAMPRRDTAATPAVSAIVTLSPSFVEGVQVHGAAGVRMTPERFLLDSLRLESRGGSLVAAGALGFEGSPIGQITAVAHFDTLALLVPVLRYGVRASGDTGAVALEGRGRITGRVIGTWTAWEAEGALVLTHAEAAGVAVHGSEVEGFAARAGDEVVMRVSLYADSVGAMGVVYAPVRGEVEGVLDSLRISGRTGFGAASAVRAALAVWRDSTSRRVRLDTLDLDLPIGTWALERPATIAVTPDTIGVDLLSLRNVQGAGRLVAHGALPRDGPADFVVMAGGVPLKDLFALAGRDTAGIEGALDLTARVAGTAATPAMEGQVYVSNGRFGEYRAPEIQVLASYQDRRLTLKGGLWRDSVRAISLAGSLPLDLALTGVARRQLPGTLTLAARADSTDLALFSAVTRTIREPRGVISFNLAFGGTWETPRLAGFAELRNAAVSVPALGVRYRDINARLELARDSIRVERLSLRGGEGTLTATGRVFVPSLMVGTRARSNAVVLDLALQARRFHAFAIRSFGSFTGSGQFRLRGPWNGAELDSGRLVVDEGYLRFADLVEKRVVNLDDPEFRAIVDSTLANAAGLGPDLQTVFLDSLRIRDLHVAMGPDVWLRSNEANIQLAGEFSVSKDIEFGLPRYRLDGTMRAVRGSYRLTFLNAASREFRVTRGTVRFYGTSDFDPDMDIAAEHVVRRRDQGSLTVRAIIGGTLLAPRLRLESDERPPLSETELVSYLMFGQLVASASSGGAGRGGAFDPIRDAPSLIARNVGSELGQALVGGIGLPLDVLTVRPGQGENILAGATIEAGVQVGSRTFVLLNAGLCEVQKSQAVGVSLEYRLSDQFATQASVEPVVRECRAGGGALENAAARYQIGFDLFWTLGGVR